MQSVSEPHFLKYFNHCTSCFLYLQKCKKNTQTLSAEVTYDVEYHHRTVKTYFEDTEWPRLYRQATVEPIGHHLWLLAGAQTLRREEKECIKDRWQAAVLRLQLYSYSHGDPDSDMLTYACLYLPRHAAAYELASGSSSFPVLHGQVPNAFTACHKLESREYTSHIYTQCADGARMYYSYFGYYSMKDASDATTLVELLLYEGALLFVKDYLAHKDSDDSVRSSTGVLALGDNLFHRRSSVSKKRKNTKPKRARAFRRTQASAQVSITDNGLTPTGKELTRRAALRTLFSNFKSDLSIDKYLRIAKLAISICQRIEECDFVACLFCYSSA